MKKSLIILTVLCTFLESNGQSEKKILFNPIIGVRIHNNGNIILKTTGSKKVLYSPIIGGELFLTNLNLGISYQLDFNPTFDNNGFDEMSLLEPYTIGEYRRTDQIHVSYLFNNFSIGLGFFQRTKENLLIVQNPGVFVRENKGIQWSFSIPFNWIDIEYRGKAAMFPHFDILSFNLQSIVLLCRLNKKYYKRNSKNFGISNYLQIRGLVGSRFLAIANIKKINGEKFSKIGIAPAIGLELLFPKWNLSLNVEKDIWISINGGSFDRDIKGYVNNSVYSLRYHHRLKNDRHVRIALGYALVEDFELQVQAVEKRAEVPISKLNKLGNYQLKGIGMALSYELFERTDIELRYIIPTLSLEKPFDNPMRLSLGLLYRFGDLN